MKELEDIVAKVKKVRVNIGKEVEAKWNRKQDLLTRFRGMEIQLEKKYSKKVRDLYCIDLERYMCYDDSLTSLDRGIATFFAVIEKLFNHIEEVTNSPKKEEKKTFMKLAGDIYSELYFIEYDLREMYKKVTYFNDLDRTLSNLNEDRKYKDYAKEIFG